MRAYFHQPRSLSPCLPTVMEVGGAHDSSVNKLDPIRPDIAHAEDTFLARLPLRCPDVACTYYLSLDQSNIPGLDVGLASFSGRPCPHHLHAHRTHHVFSIQADLGGTDVGDADHPLLPRRTLRGTNDGCTGSRSRDRRCFHGLDLGLTHSPCLGWRRLHHVRVHHTHHAFSDQPW